MGIRKVCIIISLALAGLWSLVSCQQVKKPSFIVVAADQLSFNAFACSEDKNDTASGLSTLCQESIRFTNAFSPSTQTAASLGSLLSGVYPVKHGLHRSFDRISPQLPLLQEFFKSSDYRTSFWSGKPTILKKTGLARGFDVFDDTSFLNQGLYAMDLRDQLTLFSDWVSESDEPFFSVIYTSELESLNEGETQVSNLERFDEKLGQFFSQLKKNNLWETNYIIVLGLQGSSDYGRPKESIFSNLHTENTNIALFIKPPRQKGDEGINWKIDSPLTLADFGYSLMKTVHPEHQAKMLDDFPIWDASKIWTHPRTEPAAADARKLLLESANTWKATLELRFAVIDRNYLYLESDPDEFYNKLTDGLETIDLSKTQSEITEQDIAKLNEIRKTAGAEKWTDFLPSYYDLATSNREYWSKPNNRSQLFETEKRRLMRNKDSQPLSTLLFYHLNSKIEKDSIYDDARRNSYNLSLENIWGLWDPKKNWPQPKEL